MPEQRYLYRGLDVRSNQLEREGNTARDCSNFRFDANRRLVKVNEFTETALPYDDTDTPSTWFSALPTDSEIFDFVEYNSKFVLFVKKEDGSDIRTYLYECELDGSAVSAIPCNILGTGANEPSYALNEFDGKVTSFEKDRVLYFQSKSISTLDSNPYMGKYDGLMWFRAGVPTANYTNDPDEGVLSGNDWYVRTIPMCIDDKGNQTFGPWRVDKVTTAGNISGFRNYTPLTSNYQTAHISSTSAQTLDSGNLSFTGLAFANVGDYILMRQDGAGAATFLRFQITAISGGTITLSSPLAYDQGAWLTPLPFWSVTVANFQIFSNVLLAAYFSRDYSAGYVFGDIGVSTDQGVGPNVIDFDPASPEPVPNWGLAQNFADFYGDLKFNPPAGIQVREYGEAALLIDFDNVHYSDLSVGGRVENFGAFDSVFIGERENGDIQSFFSNETFLVVMRERDTYLISGNILTGNYRVQSYRSTGIGASLSPTSVIEMDGQALFMSNRGPNIAMENGNMSNVGFRIEPIFTSDDVLGLTPDLNSADSALDVDRECLYMFIESQNGASQDFVVIFDYRYKEWLKLDGFSMRGGLLVRPSDNKMYYCNNRSLFTEKTDGYSTGIDAYWRSNYETLGKASFKKRFQRLHLFLTTLISGAIGIKSYRNWDDSTTYTDVIMTPSSSVPMDNHRLNPRLTYSTSFEITSSGTNIFESDGFEYAYEMEQEGLNDEVR